MENEEFFYAVAMPNGEIHGVTRGPYHYIRCDENVSDVTHYANVESGEVLEKRAYDYTKTVEGLSVVLDGLPGGVTVRANGNEAITNEEPLTIEFDIPGAYSVALSGHLEYVDEKTEVAVDDA